MQNQMQHDLWCPPPEVEREQLQSCQKPERDQQLSTKLPRQENGIPHRLICPITEDLMKEPVVLMDTGQVYERSAIQKWLARNNRDPITNVVLQSKQVVTVHILKSECQEFRDKITSSSTANYHSGVENVNSFSGIELAEKILQDKKFRVGQVKKQVLETGNDVCSLGYAFQMSSVGELCKKLQGLKLKREHDCQLFLNEDENTKLTQTIENQIQNLKALVQASCQQLVLEKYQEYKKIQTQLLQQKEEYQQIKTLVKRMRKKLQIEQSQDSWSLCSLEEEMSVFPSFCGNSGQLQSNMHAYQVSCSSSSSAENELSHFDDFQNNNTIFDTERSYQDGF
eukprot:TRINITY_DN1630_c1_g3_i9.p1 TRINITY_DN1630_c1_g3~~TRINITY_DN1630_c1_g3_i9.p1  ORF type:complete len:339 (-),score=39.39 TRINITY_DN1630_c1_g3_i9:363-1379(-)